MFGSLTIRDDGEWLALRFGPLPLLRKTIRYADITGVEIGRTTIIDGWGIHFIPGRGWTYNVWGFACVKLTLGRKIIRVGPTTQRGWRRSFARRSAAAGFLADRERFWLRPVTICVQSRPNNRCGQGKSNGPGATLFCGEALMSMLTDYLRPVAYLGYRRSDARFDPVYERPRLSWRWWRRDGWRLHGRRHDGWCAATWAAATWAEWGSPTA